MNSPCHGVDLTTNFDYDWTEISDCPTYSGETVNSELETRAISDFMKYYSKNIQIFIDLHTMGGQSILYPFGSRDDQEGDNMENVRILAEKSTENIEIMDEKVFVNQLSKIKYTNGEILDFAFGRLKIPYCYQIHIPGAGHNGFEVPPKILGYSSHQTFEILQNMVNGISKNRTRIRTSTNSGNSSPGRDFVLLVCLFQLFCVIL